MDFFTGHPVSAFRTAVLLTVIVGIAEEFTYISYIIQTRGIVLCKCQPIQANSNVKAANITFVFVILAVNLLFSREYAEQITECERSNMLVKEYCASKRMKMII